MDHWKSAVTEPQPSRLFREVVARVELSPEALLNLGSREPSVLRLTFRGLLTDEGMVKVQKYLDDCAQIMAVRARLA